MLRQLIPCQGSRSRHICFVCVWSRKGAASLRPHTREGPSPSRLRCTTEPFGREGRSHPRSSRVGPGRAEAKSFALVCVGCSAGLTGHQGKICSRASDKTHGLMTAMEVFHVERTIVLDKNKAITNCK